MRPFALALVFLVAGCSHSPGGPNSGPDGGNGNNPDGGGPGVGGSGGTGLYQSGSRIKAIVLNTADGAKQFWGWRDTQLNEDCQFSSASDGQTRCIPFSDPGTWYGGGGGYYVDSACATDGTIVPVGSCAGSYVRMAKAIGSTCGSYRYGIFNIGAVTDAGVYYSKDLADGGCDPSGNAVPAGYKLTSFGTEIDPSTFQAATQDIE